MVGSLAGGLSSICTMPGKRDIPSFRPPRLSFTNTRVRTTRYQPLATTMRLFPKQKTLYIDPLAIHGSRMFPTRRAWLYPKYFARCRSPYASRTWPRDTHSKQKCYLYDVLTWSAICLLCIPSYRTTVRSLGPAYRSIQAYYCRVGRRSIVPNSVRDKRLSKAGTVGKHGVNPCDNGRCLGVGSWNLL